MKELTKAYKNVSLRLRSIERSSIFNRYDRYKAEQSSINSISKDYKRRFRETIYTYNNNNYFF